LPLFRARVGWRVALPRGFWSDGVKRGTPSLCTLRTDPNLLKPTELALRYGLFAAIATTANLAAQRLVLGLGDGMPLYLFALCAGTGIGLVVKYLLDKRWIFFDQVQDAASEARKFWLYTLTGVGTTLLFWGSETLFWLAWQSESMRELGAVLGLVVGYVLKYRLDRRYVFPH
jgi:putative flippase GtrA